MTDPDVPPQSSPRTPTPEEISARLEALLKRTHSLRAERATGATGAADMTWPPPDRELDRYHVVDAQDGTPAVATDTPATTARPGNRETSPSADTVSSESPEATPREPPDARPGFAKPDWAELRLRGYTDERSTRASWPWVVAAILAGLAIAEGVYIWRLHTRRDVPAEGRLRIDTPVGAEVRVNGDVIGSVPVDQALASGAYSIEVRQHGTSARADDVIVGLGRTVLVLTPTSSIPATLAPVDDAAADASAPMTPPQLPPDVAVTATSGVVLIESTPPGMPVTMEGRPRGVTPVAIGDLRPGRHDVMIGRLFKQVDVRASEVTTLRVP